MSVEGPSAMRSPRCTTSPSGTRGFWLMQVSWFERRNLVRRWILRPVLYSTVIESALTSDTMPSPSARMISPPSWAARAPPPGRLAAAAGRGAVALGEDEPPAVVGGAGLHAGADVGGLGPQERDGLALHVGAHEGAVGVVVLEERDEGRRHRDDLLGGDVHELDLLRRHRRDLGGGAEEHVALELQLEVREGGRLRGAAHE